jgi:Secretion system C-terminal sorting domain
MNRMVRNNIVAFITVLCSVISGETQNITIVPNPTVPSLFAWTGSGALSGYSGDPIVFNNTLVLEYNPSGTSGQNQIVQQLAVYKGGDTLHLIPNPDGGQGVYLESVQLIYNNLLFFIYLDASGIQRLASFDGDSITLYPNPDGGEGYVGSPRIYNGNLYVAYSNASGVTQFGKFTGSGISLIPNPDASSTGFFDDFSVVFDNLICSRYVAADGTKHVTTYNGTSWTIWPNPDASTRGVFPSFPALYHNTLYFIYVSTVTNQFQYLKFDGTDNPSLITNPDNPSAIQGGVSGFPIVFNDTLFYQYQDASGVFRLGKFDGTTMSLVNDPDATPYGFWNTPIVYNNNLYIFYLPADGSHHLTRYDAAKNNLDTIPNPDAGYGYWDQPIVYDNKLFFMYYNVAGILQPGYYSGGNSLNLVPNPSGYYNGTAGNNGYTGYPVIWNNLLFMQFGGVPYGDAGNLAYLDAGTLPVTLLEFTAQKAGNTSLLQWKTAGEVDNSYFSIERSSDGKNFNAIGKVPGQGNTALTQSYQYIDEHPAEGKNFYRLKQVDVDDHFTYSNVVSLIFDGVSAFKVFPNPVDKMLYLAIPQCSSQSAIKIYDDAGKKVYEKQLGANASSQYMDINFLAPGTYNFSLIQGGTIHTITIIKQ